MSPFLFEIMSCFPGALQGRPVELGTPTSRLWLLDFERDSGHCTTTNATLMPMQVKCSLGSSCLEPLYIHVARRNIGSVDEG